LLEFEDHSFVVPFMSLTVLDFTVWMVTMVGNE